MNKISFLALMVGAILLSACQQQPSTGAINTAIAQTQAAQPLATKVPATITPVPTFTPTHVHTATYTPGPTHTKAPTNTATKAATTYILENGWCMMDVTADQVAGVDPKTVEWCNLRAREQVQIAPGHYLELTLENLDGEIQVYCALFTSSGDFLMSDMDTTGTGKVHCPHE